MTAGAVLLIGAIGLWVGSNLVARPAPGGPQRLTAAPVTHPLVLSFFATARDPDASFRWSQRAEVRVTGVDDEEATSVTGEGRMAGDDWVATMTVADGDATAYSGEVAVIGRHLYVRPDGEGWRDGQRVPGGALTPVNPFARIATVTELEYVGPVTRNGQDGHLMRTETWLSDPALDERIRQMATIQSRDAEMEIHIGPDGTPLSAVYTFSLEARTPAGETVTLSGRGSYTFTDWGIIGPIAAPTLNPSRPPSPAPSG